MKLLKTPLLLILLIHASVKVKSQVFPVIHGTVVEKSVAGYKLSIYLPPGYDTLKNYKVLYFNDGQTVFGKYGLNADAMADELISKKSIEPIIIVGIYSDANRTSNYVPYFDEGVKQDFGDYQPNAVNYTHRIIILVIPFIEKNFKTKPGGLDMKVLSTMPQRPPDNGSHHHKS
ncbi:MAG TPA: alpha/beta hydrolase-fold protein [Chitinophagaceae bacterium]|nr:alpha/beta hydrolase-fold protein [Chitinophagaceae bacterium]